MLQQNVAVEFAVSPVTWMEYLTYISVLRWISKLDLEYFAKTCQYRLTDQWHLRNYT